MLTLEVHSTKRASQVVSVPKLPFQLVILSILKINIFQLFDINHHLIATTLEYLGSFHTNYIIFKNIFYIFFLQRFCFWRNILLFNLEFFLIKKGLFYGEMLNLPWYELDHSVHHWRSGSFICQQSNNTLYMPFIIVLYGHFVLNPSTSPKNLQKSSWWASIPSFQTTTNNNNNNLNPKTLTMGFPSHFEIGFELGKDSPRDYNERGRKVFQMGLNNMMDVIHP